ATDSVVVTYAIGTPAAAAESSTAMTLSGSGRLLSRRRSAPSSARDSASTDATSCARSELIATSAATPNVIAAMYAPSRRALARSSRSAKRSQNGERTSGPSLVGRDAAGGEADDAAGAASELGVVRDEHERRL